MTERTGGIPEVEIQRPSSGRSWAARIEGTHPDYGLARAFLEPEERGRSLVFALAGEGDYELCDWAGERRFYLRVRREDNDVLTATSISGDEVRAEAERISGEYAERRREATDAVRAGEGRAVLVFDSLEGEDLEVPPAPAGWNLIHRPVFDGLSARFVYALYVPDDLLADPDPARKARRAFELFVGCGMPAGDAYVEMRGRGVRAAMGISGRRGGGDAGEYDAELDRLVREAGIDLEA